MAESNNANMAATALGGLGKAAGQAMDKVAELSNTFVSSSIAISKSAASGASGLDAMGATVSSVTSEFGLLGRAFGQTFQAAISVLEKNITTQQTLSGVGATFGGQLETLRSTVNKTYLGMDDFAKVVGSNSSILATFRGGVQQGTEFFSNSMGSLMKIGSQTGRMMANLGVSASEAAEMTMQLMRGQGSMNKNGQMSAEELAAATANYAAELTALSDLTGQSRKALQEQAAAEMAEAQWQSFLSGLSDEEAGKLKAGLEKELAAGGKAAGDSFKAMAAGFPPLTKASQLFAATQGASIERQQEYIRIAKDANIKTDEALKLFSTTLIQSLPGVKEDVKRLGSVPMAMAISGGTDLSKALERLTLTLNAVTGKTVEEMEANYRKFVDGSKKPGTDAEIGANQQKSAIDSANKVLAAATDAFKTALSKGLEFGDFLNKSVAIPLMGAIGKGLNSESFKKLENLIISKVKTIQDSLKEIDPGPLKEAAGTATEAAADPTKIGGQKIPALAGAVTGAMLDAITTLLKTVVDIGNMALPLINGDLKTARELLEKGVLPNFAKLFADFLKRVDQVTGILGKREAPIGTEVPVTPTGNQPSSFTSPTSGEVRAFNANYLDPGLIANTINTAMTASKEGLQQVAYNEENTEEGAVDVNKLLDEVMPLLRALVYNTGATERAIKNAPARFSNA
jgi:hypothetical protein